MTTTFFDTEVQTTSVDAAEQRLRDRYGNVRLKGLGDYRERVVGDHRFIVGDIQYEGEMRVAAEVDVVVFTFSTPGHRWLVGDAESDLSLGPVVFQPNQEMGSRTHGFTRVTTVAIPREVLTGVAEAVYAQPIDLWFDEPRAATRALGAHWMGVVALVRDGSTLHNDLTRSMVFHSLATTALESFRLTGDRDERGLSAAAGLDAYRRAARFIDEHLSLPISLADVAQAAAVSEAHLGAVFRGHSPTGVSAADHLRDERLAAAHRDLAGADPTLGDTVRAIAERWGFTHAGRFARLYRSRYGTNPKHHLDR